MSSKPTPKESAEFRRIMQQRMIESGSWQCCAICSHMRDEHDKPIANNVCSKFGMVPPAKIMATGCEEFEDVVPF